MKVIKKYFGPVCVSVLLFCALFLTGRSPQKPVQGTTSAVATEYEEIVLSHRRVLYVVVEEKGVYLGDEFVPFSLFESWLKERRDTLNPDFVKILGADLARYGQVVQVFGSVRKILMVPAIIDTKPVVIGTRRGPIEVYEHHWEY